MKQKLVLILFIAVTALGYSQNNIIGTSYSYFKLKLKKDTIDFVIADTNLSIKKPVLLFCQGSQPVPLFIKFDDQTVFPTSLSNFDLTEMNKHYHVVVISMPKTPVVVGLNHVNRSYNYVLDTAQQYSYEPAYVKADFLDNYVERANKVLQFLRKKKWVDPAQFVVAGHSQGSHIALELAATNKKVTQLGLFGFNPLGRIDQYIRMLRKQAEAKEISWEEADSIQLTVLKDYASYYTRDDTKEATYEKSWVSFSKSQLNQLIFLKIPIYISYGSNDINSDFCDLLPLYFIENQKNNYKIIRYPNLEHNFFPVNENGQPEYQNGKWTTVMNEFIKWTNNAADNK